MSDHHESRLPRNRNRIFFGLMLISFGLLFFLKKTGLISGLQFSNIWPYILILIGLVLAVKNRFVGWGPYILMFIGIFHAIPAFSFELAGRTVHSGALALPFLLVLLGCMVIFRPCTKKYGRKAVPVSHTDSLMQMDVVFGGRKEVITSKDFRGGHISATFGGAEINLMQAESADGNIVLDLRITFGGCDLLLPSHWEIRNEIVPVLGAVEDNRVIRTEEKDRKTIVILRGSCVFGGIDIKSY